MSLPIIEYWIRHQKCYLIRKCKSRTAIASKVEGNEIRNGNRFIMQDFFLITASAQYNRN